MASSTDHITDPNDFLYDGLLTQTRPHDAAVADLFDSDLDLYPSPPSFSIGSPESTLTYKSEEDLVVSDHAFNFEDFFGVDATSTSSLSEQHETTMSVPPQSPTSPTPAAVGGEESLVDAPTAKRPGGRKRKAGTVEEKELRARERVLRNRYAAQQSRDKKRRHLAELEATNAMLEAQNDHLSKRVRLVEQENAALHKKFDAITTQLSQLQSQLALSEMTRLLLDGACAPAVCAALEFTTAPRNDPARNGRGDNKDQNSSKQSPYSSPAVAGKPRGVSKKSPQRPVRKMSLLRNNSKQLANNPFWHQALKPFLVAFWILSWISTGRALLPPIAKSKLNQKGCSADDTEVIANGAELFRRHRDAVARGFPASWHEILHEWRKRPP